MCKDCDGARYGFFRPFFCIGLPAGVTAYLLPGRLPNPVLPVFSLFFYAWGEPKALPLMLLGIVLNYFAAKVVAAASSPRIWLGAAVAALLLA